MQKGLILVFALIACSTAHEVAVSDKAALEFFYGFSNFYNLEGAYNSLVQCTTTDVPAITTDLKQLIDSLSHKQWLNAVGDILALFNQFKALKTDCPAGTQPYLNVFGPAIEALEANRVEFFSTVEKDFMGNIVGTVFGTYSTIKALLAHNWESAGNGFGTLSSIGLSAWLNQTTGIKGVEISDKGAIEFFGGFSDALNLEDAFSSLLQCSGTDAPHFIADIKSLVSDLSHHQWSTAIGDALNIFFTLKSLETDCPDGVTPYLVAFGPALQAYKDDKKAFFQQVEKDFSLNIVGTATSSVQTIVNLIHHNWEKAGSFFGTLTGIGLSSYLGQSEEKKGEGMKTIFDDMGDVVSHELEGDNSAEEFLEGFSAVYGLQTACQALIQCAGSDASSLFQDISKLIDDLKDKDWVSVIADCVKIFEDIKALQSQCPSGADPYINEFEPAYEAYESNSTVFLDQVRKNIQGNAIGFIKDVASMVADLKEGNYEDGGTAFGDIGEICLSTWLPNNGTAF
jgi:hypothetical protein